jgi:phosphoserine phosphatase RsbU/P
MNHQGRQYGRKNIGNVIKQYHELSAKEIANKVKSDLQDFAGQARQHDDQSLLVMKFSI